MKAPLTKRIKAYLIDIIIILIFLGLIGIFYVPDNTLLNDKMNNVTLDYMSHTINFNEYMTNTSNLMKQIDQNNVILNIINLVFIIIYFVIYPYFNKGKTIGKQITKIEVRALSNKKISILKLFVRNLIINGLIYLIAVIICTYIVPDDIYYLVVSGLGLIQIILVLISMFMVLYRKDRKGLHDLLAGTWVSSER